MIYVDRDRKDESGEFIRPNDQWFTKAEKETKKALKEKKNHVAKSSIYGDLRVRAALEKLFNQKCAYCECDLNAGFDWDVEHFRPKGAVAEREDHPGYYWLTYDWENLLPSCEHCNQSRKDRPTWNDNRMLPASGKAAQFPLGLESTRAMLPKDDILKEDTLLIDPTYDEPVFYLGFDPTGKMYSLENNEYGTETIRVFGLNRRRLVMARKKWLSDIAEAIEIFDGLENLQPERKQSAKREFLRSFTKDDSKYSGMVRNYAGILGIYIE